MLIADGAACLWRELLAVGFDIARGCELVAMAVAAERRTSDE